MSSYTNVHISTKFDKEWHNFVEVEILNLKLKLQQRKIDRLQAELENIPLAVKEIGYVNITIDGELMKLVKENENGPKEG